MREDEREHLTDAHPETYAKFRVAVVEWMLEVCEYFSLHATTAHAAAAYLDRLQPSDRFKQKEWQLLAVCCIIVSAKYNESEEHVPDLYTLEEITKQRLPNETVLNYELWILKKIGWKLNGGFPPSSRCGSLTLACSAHDHGLHVVLLRRGRAAADGAQSLVCLLARGAVRAP